MFVTKVSENDMNPGKVYLVGAGPGDPKLITLRGIECLQIANVVIYDSLVNQILLDFYAPTAEKIYGGKMKGEQERRQAEINRQMVDYTRAGKTVVRLKGGDPFVFGRGGDEALVLAEAGIDFEIVPGVTSATAVPAYAGIPVTMRDYASSFAVVTGHSAALDSTSPIGWEKIATGIDTIVILMGVGHLDEITRRLIENGRSPQTPTVLVQYGTTPEQKTIEGTLADITQKAEEANFQSPAVIVVGEVNRLRKHLKWFEQKPLFGRKILVTRARAQSANFVSKLVSQGAMVLSSPMIEIVPIDQNLALDQSIDGLSDYDWVVFTSTNSVNIFHRRLCERGKDSRSFGPVKICAVGDKTTQALQQIGILPDFVPSESLGSVIAEEMKDVAHQRILIPRSRIGRPELSDSLRERQAIVDDMPIYDTVKVQGEEQNEMLEKLKNGDIDMVTFTSSSTAENFLNMLDEPQSLMKNVRIAVIGQSTARTVMMHGLKYDIIADQPLIENLVDNIVEFYRVNN